MRNRIITTMIVGVLALSACMSAAEKSERESKLARVRAEALERLERSRQELAQKKREQEEQQTARDPALSDWLRDNQPYIRMLCTTSESAEHDYAWENYRIAVSSDEAHASDAERIGRLIECPAVEQTSGFPWSTRPLSGAPIGASS